MQSKVVFFLLLLIVPTVLATTICPEPDCSNVQCENHQPGLTVGSDGCAHCDCSKYVNDENCPYVCPADCGQQRKENGCLECICGQLWFNPETPQPPELHN